MRAHDAETILAVHNLSSQSQLIQLDLRRWKGMRVRDLLADRVLPNVSDNAERLTLQPYQYTWLELGQ
jgi:hypothetical protein